METSFFGRMFNKRKEDKNLKKIDNVVKEALKQHINKDFSFQYSVYVWKSKSENYKEIDVADFKLYDILVEPTYAGFSGGVNGIALYMFFTDRYGDKIAFHYGEDSPTTKDIDLEYSKPWDQTLKNVLNASYVDFDSDDVDYNDPSRYPTRKGGGAIILVPNDYNTIKFLESAKELINQFDEQIKNS